MTSDQLGGVVRAMLAMLAGIAVKKGWTDGDSATTIVGGLTELAVAGWSWYTNHPDRLR